MARVLNDRTSVADVAGKLSFRQSPFRKGFSNTSWVFAAIASLMSLALLDAHAADLDTIKERGTLRVAVSPLVPFVIKNDDGTFSGFEIDAVSEFASTQGVNVEFVETPFCELADAITEARTDMVASSYSNIAERRRVLGFSLPYHDTEYYLVLSRPKQKLAKTLRAVNQKEISIGYQQGGVSGEVAKSEFSGASLKAFSSFSEIMTAMENGAIDGAVVFAPYDEMARKFKDPKFSVPHEFPLTRTIEAFALDPEAETLRETLNVWIIEKDLEGYWDDLEEKWFTPENMSDGAEPSVRCKALEPTG
ncbi:MAG: ABC transporter substrate-binding protein [Pseudomonadota bacterium]